MASFFRSRKLELADIVPEIDDVDDDEEVDVSDEVAEFDLTTDTTVSTFRPIVFRNSLIVFSSQFTFNSCEFPIGSSLPRKFQISGSWYGIWPMLFITFVWLLTANSGLLCGSQFIIELDVSVVVGRLVNEFCLFKFTRDEEPLHLALPVEVLLI